MGRQKGCKGGPGRPKAAEEKKKQYGKTSVSFTLDELRVLNRLLRNPWWRQQTREAGTCKCLKKEPRCKQIHHVFHYLATGRLDHLLIRVKNDLTEVALALSTATSIEFAKSLVSQIIEIAHRLPAYVPDPDAADDLDFGDMKKVCKGSNGTSQLMDEKRDNNFSDCGNLQSEDSDIASDAEFGSDGGSGLGMTVSTNAADGHSLGSRTWAGLTPSCTHESHDRSHICGSIQGSFHQNYQHNSASFSPCFDKVEKQTSQVSSMATAKRPISSGKYSTPINGLDVSVESIGITTRNDNIRAHAFQTSLNNSDQQVSSRENVISRMSHEYSTIDSDIDGSQNDSDSNNDYESEEAVNNEGLDLNLKLNKGSKHFRKKKKNSIKIASKIVDNQNITSSNGNDNSYCISMEKRFNPHPTSVFVAGGHNMELMNLSKNAALLKGNTAMVTAMTTAAVTTPLNGKLINTSQIFASLPSSNSSDGASSLLNSKNPANNYNILAMATLLHHANSSINSMSPVTGTSAAEISLISNRNSTREATANSNSNASNALVSNGMSGGGTIICRREGEKANPDTLSGGYEERNFHPTSSGWRSNRFSGGGGAGAGAGGGGEGIPSAGGKNDITNGINSNISTHQLCPLPTLLHSNNSHNSGSNSQRSQIPLKAVPLSPSNSITLTEGSNHPPAQSSPVSRPTLNNSANATLALLDEYSELNNDDNPAVNPSFNTIAAAAAAAMMTATGHLSTSSSTMNRQKSFTSAAKKNSADEAVLGIDAHVGCGDGSVNGLSEDLQGHSSVASCVLGVGSNCSSNCGSNYPSTAAGGGIGGNGNHSMNIIGSNVLGSGSRSFVGSGIGGSGGSASLFSGSSSSNNNIAKRIIGNTANNNSKNSISNPMSVINTVTATMITKANLTATTATATIGLEDKNAALKRISSDNTLLPSTTAANNSQMTDVKSTAKEITAPSNVEKSSIVMEAQEGLSSPRLPTLTPCLTEIAAALAVAAAATATTTAGGKLRDGKSSNNITSLLSTFATAPTAFPRKTNDAAMAPEEIGSLSSVDGSTLFRPPSISSFVSSNLRCKDLSPVAMVTAHATAHNQPLNSDKSPTASNKQTYNEEKGMEKRGIEETRRARKNEEEKKESNKKSSRSFSLTVASSSSVLPRVGGNHQKNNGAEEDHAEGSEEEREQWSRGGADREKEEEEEATSANLVKKKLHDGVAEERSALELRTKDENETAVSRILMTNTVDSHGDAICRVEDGEVRAQDMTSDEERLLVEGETSLDVLSRESRRDHGNGAVKDPATVKVSSGNPATAFATASVNRFHWTQSRKPTSNGIVNTTSAFDSNNSSTFPTATIAISNSNTVAPLSNNTTPPLTINIPLSGGGGGGPGPILSTSLTRRPQISLTSMGSSSLSPFFGGKIRKELPIEAPLTTTTLSSPTTPTPLGTGNTSSSSTAPSLGRKSGKEGSSSGEKQVREKREKEEKEKQGEIDGKSSSKEYKILKGGEAEKIMADDTNSSSLNNSTEELKDWSSNDSSHKSNNHNFRPQQHRYHHYHSFNNDANADVAAGENKGYGKIQSVELKDNVNASYGKGLKNMNSFNATDNNSRNEDNNLSNMSGGQNIRNIDVANCDTSNGINTLYGNSMTNRSHTNTNNSNGNDHSLKINQDRLIISHNNSLQLMNFHGRHRNDKSINSASEDGGDNDDNDNNANDCHNNIRDVDHNRMLRHTDINNNDNYNSIIIINSVVDGSDDDSQQNIHDRVEGMDNDDDDYNDRSDNDNSNHDCSLHRQIHLSNEHQQQYLSKQRNQYPKDNRQQLDSAQHHPIHNHRKDDDDISNETPKSRLVHLKGNNHHHAFTPIKSTTNNSNNECASASSNSSINNGKCASLIRTNSGPLVGIISKSSSSGSSQKNIISTYNGLDNPSSSKQTAIIGAEDESNVDNNGNNSILSNRNDHTKNRKDIDEGNDEVGSANIDHIPLSMQICTASSYSHRPFLIDSTPEGNNRNVAKDHESQGSTSMSHHRHPTGLLTHQSNGVLTGAGLIFGSSTGTPSICGSNRVHERSAMAAAAATAATTASEMSDQCTTMMVGKAKKNPTSMANHSTINKNYHNDVNYGASKATTTASLTMSLGKKSSSSTRLLNNFSSCSGLPLTECREGKDERDATATESRAGEVEVLSDRCITRSDRSNGPSEDREYQCKRRCSQNHIYAHNPNDSKNSNHGDVDLVRLRDEKKEKEITEGKRDDDDAIDNSNDEEDKETEERSSCSNCDRKRKSASAYTGDETASDDFIDLHGDDEEGGGGGLAESKQWNSHRCHRRYQHHSTHLHQKGRRGGGAEVGEGGQAEEGLGNGLRSGGSSGIPSQSHGNNEQSRSHSHSHYRPRHPRVDGAVADKYGNKDEGTSQREQGSVVLSSYGSQHSDASYDTRRGKRCKLVAYNNSTNSSHEALASTGNHSRESSMNNHNMSSGNGHTHPGSRSHTMNKSHNHDTSNKDDCSNDNSSSSSKVVNNNNDDDDGNGNSNSKSNSNGHDDSNDASAKKNTNNDDGNILSINNSFDNGGSRGSRDGKSRRDHPHTSASEMSQASYAPPSLPPLNQHPNNHPSRCGDGSGSSRTGSPLEQRGNGSGRGGENGRNEAIPSIATPYNTMTMTNGSVMSNNCNNTNNNNPGANIIDINNFLNSNNSGTNTNTNTNTNNLMNVALHHLLNGGGNVFNALMGGNAANINSSSNHNNNNANLSLSQLQQLALLTQQQKQQQQQQHFRHQSLPQSLQQQIQQQQQLQQHLQQQQHQQQQQQHLQQQQQLSIAANSALQAASLQAVSSPASLQLQAALQAASLCRLHPPLALQANPLQQVLQMNSLAQLTGNPSNAALAGHMFHPSLLTSFLEASSNPFSAAAVAAAVGASMPNNNNNSSNSNNNNNNNNNGGNAMSGAGGGGDSNVAATVLGNQLRTQKALESMGLNPAAAAATVAAAAAAAAAARSVGGMRGSGNHNSNNTSNTTHGHSCNSNNNDISNNNNNLLHSPLTHNNSNGSNSANNSNSNSNSNNNSNNNNNNNNSNNNNSLGNNYNNVSNAALTAAMGLSSLGVQNPFSTNNSTTAAATAATMAAAAAAAAAAMPRGIGNVVSVNGGPSNFSLPFGGFPSLAAAANRVGGGGTAVVNGGGGIGGGLGPTEIHPMAGLLNAGSDLQHLLPRLSVEMASFLEHRR